MSESHAPCGPIARSGTTLFLVTTAGGQSAVVATAPTGNTADTIVVTNRVKIDYTTAGGTYSNTITYIVTPSY